MKLRALLVIMSLAISLIPVAMISAQQNVQLATAFLFLIMVVTFFASYVISYFITRPLGKLTRNIDSISKGNLNVQLETSEIEEINILTESLDRVMASLKLAVYKAGVKKEEIFEKAEKARVEAEYKYQHLLQTLDGWVWELSLDGRCTACTERITCAIGQPAAFVIGKDLTVFFDESRLSAVREKLRERLAENKDTPFSLEHTLQHADGHIVYVQTQIVPFKDLSGKVIGFSCYSRDVTETQTALAQVEALHAKLKSLNTDVHNLFKATPSPISLVKASEPNGTDFMVLFTDDLRVVDCSQNLSEQLGMSRIEVLHRDLTELLSFPGYGSPREALDAVKQKGAITVTLRHRKGDGSALETTGILEYLKDKNLFQYRPDL